MRDSLQTGWKISGKRIEAELAVVRLSQGRYAEALERFVKGESATDAAYVAERVLTLDELKEFVDATWPPGITLEPEIEASDDEEARDCEAKLLRGQRTVIGRIGW